MHVLGILGIRQYIPIVPFCCIYFAAQRLEITISKFQYSNSYTAYTAMKFFRSVFIENRNDVVFSHAQCLGTLSRRHECW